MKRFDFETACNQLQLDKRTKLNENIKYDIIPKWVRGSDFLNIFLPHLKIIGDSREQDKWVEKACAYYGIAFEWAKKDTKSGTENLKEGDYSFKIEFANRIFDYVGVVAYERKGSISEFYGNCTGQNKNNGTSDRERITRELNRFVEKQYKKVVLMLQFGEKLTDLIDMDFSYRGADGEIVNKNTYYTVYSAIMSWKQPNNKDFDIIQSNSRQRLFWLFLQDCYYYFRNDIREECIEKGLIENL